MPVWPNACWQRLCMHTLRCILVCLLMLSACLCLCAVVPVSTSHPQIRWRSSASAALPLGQESCARRLAFFKRKPQIRAFIDSLQAQVCGWVYEAWKRVICFLRGVLLSVCVQVG